MSSRLRLRELFPSIRIGRYPTGPLNSITDVPEVYVSTQSIQTPNTSTSQAINTGVTVILPRKDWHINGSRAGMFTFNGSGEMTGSHWIHETGLLNSPIVLTNSFSVGSCYDGIYKWAIRESNKKDKPLGDYWFLVPVVGETYDGLVSDIKSMAITPEMVVQGIDNASKDRVPEGCTGGGAGMLTHGFKSGTGSASRIVRGKIRLPGQSETDSEYVVAALVQANYGKKYDLRIGGVPIGRLLMTEKEVSDYEKNLGDTKEAFKDGSIIIVISTNAPLSAIQLQRLARRATVGLARVGGWGSNTSGDIFMAFSTAHGVRRDREDKDSGFDPVVNQQVYELQDETINGIFEAAADAVEESIYNAICGAIDTEGPQGDTFHAIDQSKLKELLEKHYV